MSIRPVKRVVEATPHMEGAGVKLHRGFGFGDTTEFGRGHTLRLASGRI